MKGYTEVWNGSSVHLLDIAKQWQSLVGTEAIKVDSLDYHGTVALFIANEFIDWAHYRKTDEYICCYGQTQVNPTR